MRTTMRAVLHLLVVAVVALATGVALPGPAVTAESNGGIRVMPLGDSITEGTQVPGGYRIGLWQRFGAGGYRV
ncbi:MAG: GDSL family lipase, partial [Actinomycetota bacterium]|nr:GDSL family lipase [Actinomycetota bacterium]